MGSGSFRGARLGLFALTGLIGLVSSAVVLISFLLPWREAVTWRRIVGLHQNTTIGSTDITDTWEPLEEGLLPGHRLETTRHVSMIVITLSKIEVNKSSIGN